MACIFIDKTCFEIFQPRKEKLNDILCQSFKTIKRLIFVHQNIPIYSNNNILTIYKISFIKLYCHQR